MWESVPSGQLKHITGSPVSIVRLHDVQLATCVQISLPPKSLLLEGRRASWFSLGFGLAKETKTSITHVSFSVSRDCSCCFMSVGRLFPKQQALIVFCCYVLVAEASEGISVCATQDVVKYIADHLS